MRKPDFVIGDEKDPYLLRWYIIPRNPVFNVYLHKFLRDDQGLDLHDHPWRSISVLFSGSYVECTLGENGWIRRKQFNSLRVIFRRATHRHRIELLPDPIDASKRLPAWSLFITGRKVREWGFWKNNWRFIGHVEYFKRGLDETR